MPIIPLSNVNTASGAPMGRPEKHLYATKKGETIEGLVFYCQKIRMVDGAYDYGGAYWGIGEPIYHLQAQTKSSKSILVECFYRAESREEAKALLKLQYPSASFYK